MSVGSRGLGARARVGGRCVEMAGSSGGRVAARREGAGEGGAQTPSLRARPPACQPARLRSEPRRARLVRCCACLRVRLDEADEKVLVLLVLVQPARHRAGAVFRPDRRRRAQHRRGLERLAQREARAIARVHGERLVAVRHDTPVRREGEYERPVGARHAAVGKDDPRAHVKHGDRLVVPAHAHEPIVSRPDEAHHPAHVRQLEDRLLRRRVEDEEPAVPADGDVPAVVRHAISLHAHDSKLHEQGLQLLLLDVALTVEGRVPEASRDRAKLLAQPEDGEPGVRVAPLALDDRRRVRVDQQRVRHCRDGNHRAVRRPAQPVPRLLLLDGQLMFQLHARHLDQVSGLAREHEQPLGRERRELPFELRIMQDAPVQLCRDLVTVEKARHHLHGRRVKRRVGERHHVARHRQLVDDPVLRGGVHAHHRHPRQRDHGAVVVWRHRTHAPTEPALRDDGVAARVDVVNVHRAANAAVEQAATREANVVHALKLAERAERGHVGQREHAGLAARLRRDDEAGKRGVAARVRLHGRTTGRRRRRGEGDGQAVLVLHRHHDLRDQRKIIGHVVEGHLPVPAGEREDGATRVKADGVDVTAAADHLEQARVGGVRAVRLASHRFVRPNVPHRALAHVAADDEHVAGRGELDAGAVRKEVDRQIKVKDGEPLGARDIVDRGPAITASHAHKLPVR